MLEEDELTIKEIIEEEINELQEDIDKEELEEWEDDPELIEKRKELNELIEKYKTIIKNHYRSSTKEVEKEKLKIKIQVIELLDNYRFPKKDIIEFYKAITSKSE